MSDTVKRSTFEAVVSVRDISEVTYLGVRVGGISSLCNRGEPNLFRRGKVIMERSERNFGIFQRFDQ